jgi:hypothetical protein
MVMVHTLRTAATGHPQFNQTVGSAATATPPEVLTVLAGLTGRLNIGVEIKATSTKAIIVSQEHHVPELSAVWFCSGVSNAVKEMGNDQHFLLGGCQVDQLVAVACQPNLGCLVGTIQTTTLLQPTVSPGVGAQSELLGGCRGTKVAMGLLVEDFLTIVALLLFGRIRAQAFNYKGWKAKGLMLRLGLVYPMHVETFKHGWGPMLRLGLVYSIQVQACKHRRWRAKSLILRLGLVYFTHVKPFKHGWVPKAFIWGFHMKPLSDWMIHRVLHYLALLRC